MAVLNAVPFYIEYVNRKRWVSPRERDGLEREGWLDLHKPTWLERQE